MLALLDPSDERLLGVRGDPAHPLTRGKLCAKVNRYHERVYSPDRVLHPLRRVGPKGAGRFERLGWDEALDVIAARIASVQGEFGEEAVLPYSYGGTMGVVNHASMDRRFFYKLGASQLERTVCSAAAGVGLSYTLGGSFGADPETVPEAKLVIAWGINVVTTNLHQMPLIQAARRHGAAFVHVDVHRNRTANLADHFVQLYPGTDAALALGLMRVIVDDGLHDAQYIERHTEGFASLRQRLSEYPPERVAEITGVPADTIRWLARLYATTQPAFIRLGNGLQHHSNGGMAIRTIACLPALVGSYGQPGGGLVKSNSGYFALNTDAVERPDLLAGRRPRPVSMNQVGEALLRADPPVKLLYVYNSNPAAIAPAQAKVLAGLRREDLFTVVHEQLLTDTAAYADIVLPATTSLEHLDLYKSYWHLYLQLAEPVLAPPGESKPNIEVFSLLARQLGFPEDCFRDRAEEIISQALDYPSPYLAGITWQRLRQEKIVRLNLPARPHVAFADGVFPTPSGKVELFSQRMQADGYDPLPRYDPPAEGHDSPDVHLRSRFPLTLVTPPAHHFLNSTFANLPEPLRHERRPTVEMHPRDASPRGICEGDPVRVWNDRGASIVFAAVRETVLPGVVVGTGVWWPRHSPDGTNLNQTTPDRLADMGRGATFFSNLVEVEKAD
ncbi:MAG: molybdopterin oxidoreductase family protein [Chloroflexi bacterium]|nr:molybdopterin oxidoreductase family protein [Chloroflexota bacterium]MCL5107832.1 molybdopterin oxidoreductase family protein [Chloroflexota bacterium]